MTRALVATVVALVGVVVGVHARSRTGSWLSQGNSSLAPWAWTLGVFLLAPLFVLWYVIEVVRVGRDARVGLTTDASDETRP